MNSAPESVRPVVILLVEDNPGDVVLTREALMDSKILIDLHAAGLAAAIDAVGAAHERLLASEGRITVLELMGYLASYLSPIHRDRRL
jgi:hypothetical protein